MLLPGQASLDISPPELLVNTQASFLIKAGIDVPVIPGWYVSGKVMASQVSLPDMAAIAAQLPAFYRDQIPTSVSGFQVSAGPKADVILNDSLTMKFAIYGGYRTISGDTEFANSQGFAFDVASELHIDIGAGLTQYWELGFLTQPMGGREGDYYLTFGPILYLLAGIAY